MPIATYDRKAIQQTLTVRMNTPYVQFSKGFDDPDAFLLPHLTCDLEHDLSALVIAYFNERR